MEPRRLTPCPLLTQSLLVVVVTGQTLLWPPECQNSGGSANPHVSLCHPSPWQSWWPSPGVAVPSPALPVPDKPPGAAPHPPGMPQRCCHPGCDPTKGFISQPGPLTGGCSPGPASPAPGWTAPIPWCASRSGSSRAQIPCTTTQSPPAQPQRAPKPAGKPHYHVEVAGTEEQGGPCPVEQQLSPVEPQGHDGLAAAATKVVPHQVGGVAVRRDSVSARSQPRQGHQPSSRCALPTRDLFAPQQDPRLSCSV